MMDRTDAYGTFGLPQLELARDEMLRQLDVHRWGRGSSGAGGACARCGGGCACGCRARACCLPGRRCWHSVHTPARPPFLPVPAPCSHAEGLYIHIVFDAMGSGYSSQHNTLGMIGALRTLCRARCATHAAAAVPAARRWALCSSSQRGNGSLAAASAGSAWRPSAHPPANPPAPTCSELYRKRGGGQLHHATGQRLSRSRRAKGAAAVVLFWCICMAMPGTRAGPRRRCRAGVGGCRGRLAVGPVAARHQPPNVQQPGACRAP